ncbi:hypothetical protein ACS0TY_005146 [Phlomoides rotata]
MISSSIPYPHSLCSSKFRCSTTLHIGVCSSSSSLYSYSLPSAATPPQITKFHGCIAARGKTLHIQLKAAENEVEHEEEDFQVVWAVESNYNHIVILDTPKSRLLLLDSCHNVHSMLNKESKWTGSYWDEFATLPPVVPRGPIAIFGLLIDKSREYFGLRDLEKHTRDGGVLNIHIGDVFSPEAAAISGGYAGIIVDLFAQGKVLPQLQQAATWLELYDKLMREGRFMVNCGAGEKGHDGSSTDGSWKLNATIRALFEAFPGQVNWKKMPQSAGENYVALTGFLPDLTTWSAAVPDELNSSVNEWRTCNMHGS